MEDDEDDLYGENGTTTEPQHNQNDVSGDAVDESDEEEDMDEADSDSDVEIVTERPPGEELTAAQSLDTAQTAPRASAAIPIVAPTQQSQTAQQQQPFIAIPGGTTGGGDQNAPPQTLESGLGFPGVHSSTIDVNGNPIYTPMNKPITEIEIDVDLIEHEKPWRRPGADQSDWFNYGFDEFSWSTYCMRQKTMSDTIVEQRAENAQFENMFGGGGGGGGAGGGPGAGIGMPGMPPNPMIAAMGAGAGGGVAGMPPGMAMPNEQEFQVAMMEAMRLQGVSDPSQVDFNAFMAQLQGGGGAAMKQQQQHSQQQQNQGYDQGTWQQGGGGIFQGGGGRGGYGRGKRGQRY